MHRLSSEFAALSAVLGRMDKHHFSYSRLLRVRQAGEALRDVVNSDIPGETPAQRMKRWTTAAEQYNTALERTRNALVADELGGRSNLQEQRRQALGMESDRYALPIVNAFAAADSGQRIAWLAKAAEERDGRTLATLVEAPEFVTGIDGGTLGKFLQLAEEKHAPEIARRREKFTADLETMEVALRAAGNLGARAVDPSELREAAEAERLQREAQQRLQDATAAH